MKNHWLDKKTDKEINAAFEEIANEKAEMIEAEFQDSDFIDPSSDTNLYTKETYNIVVQDKADRELVKEILLRNIHKTHWVDEVLAQVGYVPLPTTSDYNMYLTGDFPGGNGLTLGDLDKFAGGVSMESRVVKASVSEEEQKKIDDMKVLCTKCGEYQWPMNDENTMTQGDPMCACYRSSCNLDIFYPDAFIQNETLQVYSDNANITVYITEFTPVLPGTMCGYIHLQDNTFTITVSAGGKCDVQCINAENQDKVYIYDASLNHDTGELKIHHIGVKPRVVVSYEYAREGR